MSRPSIPRVLRAVAVVVTAAAAGACASTPAPPGGAASRAVDPSADAATAAPTATSGADDPMLEFQRCMADHGIEVSPIGGQDGSYTTRYPADLDPTIVTAASESCEPLLGGAFGEFDDDPEEDAARRDRDLAFRRCLEDLGIELPDGLDAGDGIAAVTGDRDAVEVEGATVLDIDPDELQRAFDECGPAREGQR